MKNKKIILLFSLMLLISSCNTIGSQQWKNEEDNTQKSETLPEQESTDVGGGSEDTFDGTGQR